MLAHYKKHCGKCWCSLHTLGITFNTTISDVRMERLLKVKKDNENKNVAHLILMTKMVDETKDNPKL